MLPPPSSLQKNVTHTLSKSELNYFHFNGFSQSFPFLSQEDVNHLMHEHSAHKDEMITGKELKNYYTTENCSQKAWFKSLHAIMPAFRKVLSHPIITEKIATILGDNVMLWGSSITTRIPRQVHRWHVDIEHQYWKGVSIFIALNGASSLSSLKVIPGSHEVNAKPVFSAIKSDEDVLLEAGKYMNAARIEHIPINVGEFFIFDGLLWHGSENNSNQTRHAIIAQYTTPDQHTRIPLNWDEPIVWSDLLPPCHMVKGRDEFKINRFLNS